MSEPAVKVLLFSDLFGTFADGDGACEVCSEHFQRLRSEGVEVVLVSGGRIENVATVLADLRESAVVLADGGNTLLCPEGHLLGPSRDIRSLLTAGRESQLAAAEWIIDRYMANGSIVITLGIGGSPDDTFLEGLDVAALIPGADGTVCPQTPRADVCYVCSSPGQRGWNEWAEIILRRVQVVPSAD
jgi:predicted mannosyl-3-phosphoglycerate phosphatase (HAD superfamily)